MSPKTNFQIDGNSGISGLFSGYVHLYFLILYRNPLFCNGISFCRSLLFECYQ